MFILKVYEIEVIVGKYLRDHNYAPIIDKKERRRAARKICLEYNVDSKYENYIENVLAAPYPEMLSRIRYFYSYGFGSEGQEAFWIEKTAKFYGMSVEAFANRLESLHKMSYHKRINKELESIYSFDSQSKAFGLLSHIDFHEIERDFLEKLDIYMKAEGFINSKGEKYTLNEEAEKNSDKEITFEKNEDTIKLKKGYFKYTYDWLQDNRLVVNKDGITYSVGKGYNKHNGPASAISVATQIGSSSNKDTLVIETNQNYKADEIMNVSIKRYNQDTGIVTTGEIKCAIDGMTVRIGNEIHSLPINRENFVNELQVAVDTICEGNPKLKEEASKFLYHFIPYYDRAVGIPLTNKKEMMEDLQKEELRALKTFARDVDNIRYIQKYHPMTVSDIIEQLEAAAIKREAALQNMEDKLVRLNEYNLTDDGDIEPSDSNRYSL